MPRSFRLLPPEPRPDLLARPRLMRTLLGRWECRVTALVGGAGLGKTTVLAQAIAENRLAPRGEDLWFGLETHDATWHVELAAEFERLDAHGVSELLPRDA